MVLLVAAMWWLSGWDAHVTGENKNKDFIRRILRIAITLTLIWIFFIRAPVGYGTIPLIMIIPILIGVLWCGPLSELLSNKFHRLLGAGSDAAFQPDKSSENVEMVANLIRAGRHQEALELYDVLKDSADANIVVIETLLDRAGISREQFRRANPLSDADRLQQEGKYLEAEVLLKSLLAQDPENVAAAMMLMRLYVQDLHQSDKAAEILRHLQKQPHISSPAIEYAQRSLYDWRRKKTEPQAEPLPESVEGLLQAGYYGTAIEILEQTAKEQPENFEAQLKLAEAYGLHSGDTSKAKKIIEELEKKSCFSPEQIQTAKTKFNEWRETKPQ